MKQKVQAMRAKKLNQIKLLAKLKINILLMKI